MAFLVPGGSFDGRGMNIYKTQQNDRKCKRLFIRNDVESIDL